MSVNVYYVRGGEASSVKPREPLAHEEMTEKGNVYYEVAFLGSELFDPQRYSRLPGDGGLSKVSKECFDLYVKYLKDGGTVNFNKACQSYNGQFN